MSNELFTDAQRRVIRKEYENRTSVTKLAKEYGVTDATICRNIVFAGGVIRPRGESRRTFSVKQSETLRREYEKGASTITLASKYKCSPGAVINAIRRVGGTLRSGAKARLFSEEQAQRLRVEYEAGKTPDQLGKKYGGTAHAIRSAVRHAGGHTRTITEAAQMFSMAECKEIREEYENRTSISKLAKQYQCSFHPIRQAIIRADGVIRKNTDSNRKYFRNPQRENSLFQSYRITVSDTDYLHNLQKGLCLWCLATLPKDSLNCLVDHIGGRDTRGQRDKVRGLCCPDNTCNILAGRIEKNGFADKAWGLVTPLVRHIRHVLKTNHGNLFERAA